MEYFTLSDIKWMSKTPERRVEIERVKAVYETIKNHGVEVKSKEEAKIKGNESKLDKTRLREYSGVGNARKYLEWLIELGVACSVEDQKYNNHIYFIKNENSKKLDEILLQFRMHML